MTEKKSYQKITAEKRRAENKTAPKLIREIHKKRG